MPSYDATTALLVVDVQNDFADAGGSLYVQGGEQVVPFINAEIKRAQAAGDPDTGETYYSHWLATLERLVAAKGVATADLMHRYRDAWDRASDRTPHGKPIELTKEDFG